VAALRDDVLLGPLVRESPGLRLPGAWDRFETGVRVLLGQQVSVTAATTLAGRLVERYGEPLTLNLPAGLTHLFPAAERLAEARDLAEIGLPKARAGSLREFARQYADGTLNLAGTADLEQLTGRLMELPGIGPWSAHMLAARVYGHADAFPASDLGLRRAVGRLLGRADLLPADELCARAERWRPYRATAAAQLWFAGASGRIEGGRP
jgi:AraC family transcriptional regulator of adaptative response / DNA-3-methyladenine glycosylase II